MGSKVLEERSMSPSYLFDEIRFPAERQVGFWDHESMLNHHGFGIDGLSRIAESKLNLSSPPKKLAPVGTPSVECIGISQPYFVRDQKAHPRHVVGAERLTNLSMPSWRSMENNPGIKSNIFGQATSYFSESNKVDMGNQYENSLFSNSFSESFGKKLRLSSNGVPLDQSVDAATPHQDEDEPFESLEEIEAQTIGNLLPDDDDLLSGLNGDLKYIVRPNSGDDIDGLDIFSSGGGMELGGDDGFSSSWIQRNSEFHGGMSTGGALSSSIIGEHPYGEHPSRTLFVRNISSNIEDSELRALFEQYGDIRTLYTACKHRGFVMISYYDIRAASNAIRALQNKPLRRRKLDIHFSIPKDLPSEKDINQGTLVVHNLDLSVSSRELQQVFGAYGEIKEMRETPHKGHHMFVEFYDIRAAEAALHALNNVDVAGKRIIVEPSQVGVARLSSMDQSFLDFEQEGLTPCPQQGSPPSNSPSPDIGPVSHGEITSSCMDVQGLRSAIGVPISQFMENGLQQAFPGSVPQSLISSIRGVPFGNQSGLGEPSHTLGQMEYGFQHMPPFHPHSLPDYHDGLANGVPYSSPDINPRPTEGYDNRHIHRVGSNGHSIEPIDSVFSSGNGSSPLHGHHYMWSHSNSYRPPNHMMWLNPPSYVNGVPGHPSAQLHRFPRVPSTMLNAVPLHRHHVGSAPAVNPSLWDRRLPYSEPHEVSSIHPGSLGSTGFSGSPNLYPLEFASHNVFPRAGGNCMDPSMASTKNVGLHSPQNRCHMLPRRNPMMNMSPSFDTPNERFRSRRIEVNSNQMDGKKQYELDIDRIFRREDIRTTLMIKNIPNKYTSKMLLAAIDEHHRGTYDFIYLPIDFKNKCNVGYAFINMIDPLQIVPFYQAFNGKKWEKFNSEKVASLAYARIQGKAALIAHFQNSSLMNEDKRCRPILFHSDGPNAGDQEPFPMGVNMRSRSSKSRTNSSDENYQGSPSTSANGEQYSNGTDSSSGSE